MYEQADCDLLQKPEVKLPVDAFERCPACGSSRLIPVSDQVLCRDCDWISVFGFVSAGGMDHMMKPRLPTPKLSAARPKSRRQRNGTRRTDWRRVFRELDADLLHDVVVA